MRSLMAYLKKHPVFLLLIIILITAVAGYYNYIFGGYLFLFDDIGSDTKQLYIMQYNSIVNHLRSGDFSFWDATNGFGTSMYQYTLFNPLLCILYIAGLLFGNAVMAKMLVWIVILAMLVSGVAMWYFLSCFNFSNRSKLLAAYIYSFNGFLTLWGQHFAFLAIMIYMPLVLMLLEKAIRAKRFSPAVALSMGLTVLCTYYFSYMFIIIAAIYVILRAWTLRLGTIRGYFSVVAKQALAVLLGMGVGMLNLLPSAGIVFNVSSRTESSTTLLERVIEALAPYSGSYYKTLAYRFLSSGLQGNTSAQEYTGYSNYYEAPSVFFTSLFVFLFVQFIVYIIVKKWDKRLKIASVLSVCIGLFVILVPLGSLPFNFFTYVFSRHTFLLMPFFALLTAFMLERLFKERFLSIAGLLITAAACIYVYYSAYKGALMLNVAVLAAGLCVLTMFLAVFLFMYRKGPKKLRPVLYVLIFLSVMGQTGADLLSTVRGREIVSSDGDYFEELYGEDYQELSAWLEENDDDRYRIVRDFTTASYCMDNLALDYEGVSSYNSTMNSNILNFINQLLPDMSSYTTVHTSFRQIAEKTQLHDLFGIKYIVSKSDTPPYEGYELVKQFGEIYLYQNTSWSGFASFYTSTASQSEYEGLKESGALIDTAALMSQVLILEDEDIGDAGLDSEELGVYEKTVTTKYSIDESGMSEDISRDGSGKYTFTFDGTNVVYIPFNQEIESGKTISVSFSIEFMSGYNIYISTDESGYSGYLATISEGDSVSVNITLPSGTKGLYLPVQHEGATISVYGFEFYESEYAEYEQNAEITSKDTGSDGRYVIEVDASEDGYLLTPIPYEDGWSVKVDGEEVSALKADYGFTAVWLEAGEHTIEYEYEQPYLKEGAVISGLSVLICIAVLVKRKKHVV